jgi:hypothetical protein
MCSGVFVGVFRTVYLAMTFNTRTAISDFEERITEVIREVKLTVFVCGPAVIDASGKPSLDPGAAVRRYVSEKIEKEGHCYIWGEHLPSKGGGPEAWIRRFDNANKEILFALHDNTDMVVIFPSSSGSLAELGAFCMHDGISPKMLIVFDKKFQGDEGFVVKALGKAARSRNATICFQDYARPKGVWTVVRRAIEKRRLLKTVRRSHG